MNNFLIALKKDIRHIIALVAVGDYITFLFRVPTVPEICFVGAIMIIMILRDMKNS